MMSILDFCWCCGSIEAGDESKTFPEIRPDGPGYVHEGCELSGDKVVIRSFDLSFWEIPIEFTKHFDVMDDWGAGGPINGAHTSQSLWCKKITNREEGESRLSAEHDGWSIISKSLEKDAVQKKVIDAIRKKATQINDLFDQAAVIGLKIEAGMALSATGELPIWPSHLVVSGAYSLKFDVID